MLIIGIVLFIIFIIFFLATLVAIMAVGAVAGLVFMYFRATVSYINSVKEEVTNPFAKGFTIAAVIIIAILPVVALVAGPIIGMAISGTL